MAETIPAACSLIQSNIDDMKSDLAEYEFELRSDPDMNKNLLMKGIARLTQQIAAAQDELDTCIASSPPDPPPPPPLPTPPIPAECKFIQLNIDDMNSDMAEYERELKSEASPNCNNRFTMPRPPSQRLTPGRE